MDPSARSAMLVVVFLLALLAFIGHAALWVGLANRVHSTGLPRRLLKSISALCHLLLVTLPVAVIWLAVAKGWFHNGTTEEWLRGNWVYLTPFWVIGIATIGLWARRNFQQSLPASVHKNTETIVDVAAKLNFKPLSGVRSRLLSLVPGNQVLELVVQEMRLTLDRLPKELDGLSIAHLSDLHFTGRIGVEFFEEVVRQTTALRADMIVITGDVLDEIEYLDWFDRTLAKLSAPLGIYFVLGNHDEFTGEAPRLRRALETIGMIDLGEPLEAIGTKRRGNHPGGQRTAVVYAASEYAELPGPNGRQRPITNFAVALPRSASLGPALGFRFDVGWPHARRANLLADRRPDRLPEPPRRQICQRHVLRSSHADARQPRRFR